MATPLIAEPARQGAGHGWFRGSGWNPASGRRSSPSCPLWSRPGRWAGSTCPSVRRSPYSLQGTSNRVLGGLVVALLAGTGGLAALTIRHWPPRRAMSTGCVALVAGGSVTVVGVAVAAPSLFYAGTIAAGAGFGAAFLGAFRTLAALATPARRGELATAIYVAAYLAFSVPPSWPGSRPPGSVCAPPRSATEPSSSRWPSPPGPDRPERSDRHPRPVRPGPDARSSPPPIQPQT